MLSDEIIRVGALSSQTPQIGEATVTKSSKSDLGCFESKGKKEKWIFKGC